MRAGNAAILGASSGIGREMALWLGKRGWRVGVTGRREELLEELSRTAPDRIIPMAFDVRRSGELPARLDSLADAMGGLDLLVVSAGTGHLNPGLLPEPEADTIATNVDAFTAAAVWGYGHFQRRGGGRLAAITSVGGLIAEGAAPAYAASKAYQILYLDGLRKRARKDNPGCQITEIRPGPVRTAMMKGEGHFWIASPEQAADIACRAILRGRRLQYILPRWAVLGAVLRGLALFS